MGYNKPTAASNQAEETHCFVALMLPLSETEQLYAAYVPLMDAVPLTAKLAVKGQLLATLGVAVTATVEPLTAPVSWPLLLFDELGNVVAHVPTNEEPDCVMVS